MVSQKKRKIKRKATDMQRNHAGLNFTINYVWLKTSVQAAEPKFGRIE